MGGVPRPWVASPAMDGHSRHTHPRWRAGDGSNSEVTFVSECHSGQAGRHGISVACDQGCAPSPHTVRRHPFDYRNTHCRERYCVKLLGVGRGDAVAAWPSQDRTPLNEPFERLVSDHRRPDTVYVLPSDSVLLYKDPPCEPKSDLTYQNQQFRNKQTNTRPIFSPLLGGSPPPDRRPLPCLLHRPFCPNTDAAPTPTPPHFLLGDVAKRCFLANSVCANRRHRDPQRCVCIQYSGAGASSYHSMCSFLPSCVTTTSSAHGVPATCTLCLLSCPTYFSIGIHVHCQRARVRRIILLSAACLCRPRRSEADCACLLPSLLHNGIAVRMIPPRPTTLSRMGCAVPFWRFLPLKFVV